MTPHSYDSEDRKYLRQLFVQHAFLLNAIESEPACQALVEKVMTSFMADQRAELKPADDEPSNIITHDRLEKQRWRDRFWSLIRIPRTTRRRMIPQSRKGTVFFSNGIWFATKQKPVRRFSCSMKFKRFLAGRRL
jgi:hypothetical protein